MQNSDLEKMLKPVVFLLVIGVFAGIHFLIPDFYPTIWHLTVTHDIPGLTHYIESFGSGAVILMILLIVLTNMTGLPSIQFLTINGILFGLVPGILLSWIGEVIGNIVGFLMMRYMFRDTARNLIKKHSAAEKIDSVSSFKLIALFRAIPYSPNLVITALCSLSSVGFVTHAAATLVGKLPSVLIEVLLGHSLIRFCQNSSHLMVWVGVAGLSAAAWFFYKKRYATK